MKRLREWWRKQRRHECWPPRGAVFDPIWQCPDCGDGWELVQHANHSEWIRMEGS